MEKRKKIVYWTGLIVTMLIFGSVGLWGGISKGNAQTCVSFKTISCMPFADIFGFCNCPDGFTKVNTVKSGWNCLGVNPIACLGFPFISDQETSLCVNSGS